MSPYAGYLPPKVERSSNVRVVTFAAANARDVENVIARELEGITDGLGESHLLLDFTNVKYLHSVELGTLITLHKKMKASGGRLTLFNLTDRIYEIFTVTHLQTLLGICREGRTHPGRSPGPAPARNEVAGAAKAGIDSPGDPDKYVHSQSQAAGHGGDGHSLEQERYMGESRWLDDGGRN